MISISKINNSVNKAGENNIYYSKISISKMRKKNFYGQTDRVLEKQSP